MRIPQELLEHELKDLYDAENRLLESMNQMLTQAKDTRLQEAIREHRAETFGQIERLRTVFDMIGREVSRERCIGVAGLIDEYSRVIGQDPFGQFRDFVTAVAGVKAEHYEMVAYRSAILSARMCGFEDAARLLEQNLREEHAAALKLGELADEFARGLGAKEGAFHPDAGLGDVVRTGLGFARTAAEAGTRALRGRRTTTAPKSRATTTRKKATTRRPASKRTTAASRARKTTTTTSRRPSTTGRAKASGPRRTTTARRAATTRSRTTASKRRTTR